MRCKGMFQLLYICVLLLLLILIFLNFSVFQSSIHVIYRDGCCVDDDASVYDGVDVDHHQHHGVRRRRRQCDNVGLGVDVYLIYYTAAAAGYVLASRLARCRPRRTYRLF